MVGARSYLSVQLLGLTSYAEVNQSFKNGCTGGDLSIFLSEGDSLTKTCSEQCTIKCLSKGRINLGILLEKIIKNYLSYEKAEFSIHLRVN